jgi:DNA-binding Lrp family transcriptional regulator
MIEKQIWLDEKDQAILEELRKDSRSTTTQIAKKTRIPRVTVHERIRKLKKGGVIKLFTVAPDYAKLGRPSTAFILIAYAQGPVSQRELARKISLLPGVFEVHAVTGEWDFLVKARGASLQEIGELVVDKLRALPGVARTQTIACFSTIKEEL